MPFKVRAELLSLSGQTVTANAASVFLNGVAVGVGDTDGIALSGKLTQTGVALGTSVAALSGLTVGRMETVPLSIGPATWTTMPGSGSFFLGTSAYATFVDLTRFTGVNLVVNRTNVAGAATGFLWLGYRVAPFQLTPSGYSRLDTLPTNIPLNAVNTVVTSGFAPIVAAARGGVYLGLFGSGGGALSPTFGNISVLFL